MRRLSLRTLPLIALAALAAAVAADLAFARGTAAVPNAGIVIVQTNLAYQDASAAGTGMVLTSSGEVLTNNHVIHGATSIKVVVPQTHRTYTATVAGYAVGADVAVLKLKGASGLATVTLGDSSTLRVGARRAARSGTRRAAASSRPRPGRSPACAGRSPRATARAAASGSPAWSRRTPRSSRATPAGRSSTPPGASSG